MRRRVAWTVLGTLAILAAAGGGGAFWIRGRLLASLPQLDGRIQLPGLRAAVSVKRDALGIPTIRATSREDLARATGFLHAQDRFFQMDLARRRAAGELAELVGPAALPVDRQTRLHRFRALARKTVGGLADRDRRILAAYTAGVNAGLSQLGAPPFEYLLLRQQPQPWREEDTMLVVLSMFLTLQDSEGTYESTLATMRDVLPAAMVDFLAPVGTEWDTPVQGDALAVPPIPGPDIYNLRARRQGKQPIQLPPPRPEVVDLPTPNFPPTVATPDTFGSWTGEDHWALGVDNRNGAIGSNSFAVAGRLTASGSALVANDMHLAVRVPNTWYRATFVWSDPTGKSHLVAGVTLPGHPAMVIGSNEHIAWGFTNTYADFADIVLLDIDRREPDRYRTPHGWKPFEHYDEVIKVAGQADEHLAVTWTIWGPVIDPDHAGRPRALRWVAHSIDQQITTATPLESATTIEEALAEANGLAAPGQNMVVADRSGRVAWSIFGSIPRRSGMTGDTPLSWADGTHGWNGWLDDDEYPRIVAPPGGRIWSANNRVTDESTGRVLGNGNYEVGSRARIIRDRLMASDRFEPRDLLDIQLDTSASFLARWRDLILRTLTASDLSGRADRTEFRDVVRGQWSGQVTADSAAYLLTRLFRERVSERVFGFLLSECYEADATFDYRFIRRREGPIWKAVTEQPLHLLDPAFSDWHELLLTSIDEVIARVRADHPGPLNDRQWGEYNVTRYRHPLSGAAPFLWRWLDMPAQPLPGDLYTPNMHWGINAPSERMVVSPGREIEGLMDMPTGQSGHPLSPFYANSHPAWVAGSMSPLLGGPAIHSITFAP
ncbi:MAG TPA: penicillin acylase family protein [Vicinamibacterales bacterium]|nr:penicillin acylase family protein [Vicinamibacterales bacterium]